MLSAIFLDPLRGRTRLWRVAFYMFVANCCFSAIGAFFLAAPASTSEYRFFLLLGLIVGLYQLIALWQCAHNSPSPFLARLVRTAVAGSFILVPLFIYLLITNPTVLSN
jgi:predicted neutral ceramidase superfamily lipid hydrolase